MNRQRERQEVVGAAKGNLVRAVLRATARRDAEDDGELRGAMTEAEKDIVNELRRPSDSDRDARIVHAVTSLFAALVS